MRNDDMNKPLRFRLGVGALVLVLAGCAVGPQYQRPATDVPASFKEASMSPEAAKRWKEAQPADSMERGRWWTIFQDARLNELEEQAMVANQDLKAAAARVAQARALTRNARSELFPRVDAGFGPTRQRASNASQGLSEDASNAPLTLWRAQASVSYEADLFGRVASQVDAATASAQQSQALYRSVLLALQADVAQAYFLVRRLDAEKALYDDTVELRKQTLELIERRYVEGDISELDVARARTELDSARSQSLGVDRQRAIAGHALAILMGACPGHIDGQTAGRLRPESATLGAGRGRNPGRIALIVAGAPPRHCGGRTRHGGGECPDRSGQGRIFSTLEHYWNGGVRVGPTGRLVRVVQPGISARAFCRHDAFLADL